MMSNHFGIQSSFKAQNNTYHGNQNSTVKYKALSSSDLWPLTVNSANSVFLALRTFQLCTCLQSLLDDNKEQAGFVVANKTFLWIRDAPAP